jgi:hypothetical protein
MTNVVFSGNSAYASSSAEGGGMYNYSSSPTLTNVVFSENSATGYYAYGGGMYNESASSTLTNVVFVGNTVSGSSSYYGGGIYNDSSSILTIYHGSFYQNAEAAIENDGTATIINSVFYDNDGIDVQNNDTLDISYTCSQQVLAGTENQSLTTDPFVLGPFGELFLNQDPAVNPCVDTGNNDAADKAYDAGVDNAGVHLGSFWRDLTTDIDSALDTDPVDMGVHYTP